MNNLLRDIMEDLGVDIPIETLIEERNIFQQALDEIAIIIDGKTASTMTDADLDAIREEVLKR